MGNSAGVPAAACTRLLGFAQRIRIRSISSSGTVCCRSVYQIASCGMRLNGFCRSRKAIYNNLCFSRGFSTNSRAAWIASMVLQLTMKPHWLVGRCMMWRIRQPMMRSNTSCYGTGESGGSSSSRRDDFHTSASTSSGPVAFPGIIFSLQSLSLQPL